LFCYKIVLEVRFSFFISAEICNQFYRAGVQASQMQITGRPIAYT